MCKDNFFEILSEQLDALEKFLACTSSRIISYEILDYLIDVFFMIKRIFVECTFYSSSCKYIIIY